MIGVDKVRFDQRWITNRLREEIVPEYKDWITSAGSKIYNISNISPRYEDHWHLKECSWCFPSEAFIKIPLGIFETDNFLI